MSEMPSNDRLLRGATEGPLKQLKPVFIDVETHYTNSISLSRMTLRSYLAASYIETLAIAIGDDKPVSFASKRGKFVGKNEGLTEYISDLARDPQIVFVAHNAAFDIRALRFCLGIPQPFGTATPRRLSGHALLRGGFPAEHLSHQIFSFRRYFTLRGHGDLGGIFLLGTRRAQIHDFPLVNHLVDHLLFCDQLRSGANGAAGRRIDDLPMPAFIALDRADALARNAVILALTVILGLGHLLHFADYATHLAAIVVAAASRARVAAFIPQNRGGAENQDRRTAK